MRLIHGFDPNVPDDHGVSQYITLYCCGITVPTIKYIAEPTAQMRQRFAPGISRYGLAPVMEYLTNVIDPMTMIRVIMGPQNGIYIDDIRCQYLLTQVRRSVDQNACGGAFDDDRRSGDRKGVVLGKSVSGRVDLGG